MKKALIVLAVFLSLASTVFTADDGKKLSFSTDVSIKSFRDNIESQYFFGGGEIDNTSFKDEYEIGFNVHYSFTKRFSLVASSGYIKTSLNDPVISYDNDISAFYPYDSRICKPVANPGDDWSSATGIIQESGLTYVAMNPDEPPYSPNSYNGNEVFVEGRYGELRQIPLGLYFRIDLMPDLKWKPYVAGGIGYVFNDFKEENTGAEYLDNLNYSATVLPYGTDIYGGYNERADADHDGIADGIVYQRVGGDYYYLPFYSNPTYEGWTIEIKDSLTYNLETGFDYELSDHWNFVFKLRYTWVQEKIKSRINGETDFLAFTETDPKYYIDRDPSRPRRLHSTHGIVHAQGGDMNMDSVQAGMGFKYTF